MIKEIWYDEDGETKRIDVNGRTIQNITKKTQGHILNIKYVHEQKAIAGTSL